MQRHRPILPGFLGISIRIFISFSMLAFSSSLLLASRAYGKGKTSVSGSSTKNLCQQGKNQYAAGDVLTAISTLTKCLDRDSQNREALVNLAKAFLEVGKFSEAVEAFSKAQALKSGDANFLAAYLDALDGAGLVQEQVAVFGFLVLEKVGDRKTTEKYLAAIESAGKEKYPQEYLAALQTLVDYPDAGNMPVEKLAMAYLNSGSMEKAEAEYRGLLLKRPEFSEYWAGLAKAQSKRDPVAAAECYRKAAFYSDQATQRKIFLGESERLAKSEKVKTSFDIEAFKDSVYQVELKKQMAARNITTSDGPNGVPSVALTTPSEEKTKAEKQEKYALDEKAKQDRMAREEKAKKTKLDEDEKARLESLAHKENAKNEKKTTDARAMQARSARAISLYSAGQLDSAAELFKLVLQDSASSEVYYFSGRTSLDQKDYNRALERFAKTNPDRIDLEGLKGQAFMGLGKHREAVLALKAQYSKVKSDSLLVDLVSEYQKLGDVRESMLYLEKLVEVRPNIEAYHQDLAFFYQGKGDKGKATEHFSKILLLNPNHADANGYLGLEYSTKGESSQAVPLLEKAVLAFPKRVDFWKALAASQALSGRKDLALEAITKALALAPKDLELAKTRLALSLDLGKAIDFGSAYEDILKISPKDKEAAMGLAKLRFEQKKYAEAEKYFRIACSDSKDYQALAQFGRVLIEVKKNDEATSVLQKAIDLGNKDVSIRYDLARIRMEKGDLDWADGLVKDLSQKLPTDPEPIYWQGLIAVKRLQPALAIDFFARANRLKPTDGKYAEALAHLHYEKDDFKTAANVLKLAEPDLASSGRLLFGDCLAHSGEGSRAINVYGDLFKVEPSALIMSRRLDLFVLLGRPEEAVELAHASPYLKDLPFQFSLAKAQLALSEAHIIKADIDQAVDLMKKVLDNDEHNAEYHFYLGLAYLGQNRFKKARNAFVDALTYRTDYPQALYHKGRCQIKLDDILDAENSFGELSQHAEPLWKARGLYGLALAFFSQGKSEAVESYLERSILAYPLPEAMAFISRIRLKQLRVDEAEQSARKALLADPLNEEAVVALANALSAAKRQNEAMELAQQGLRARPLSCGLLIQSAKMTFESGKLDSARSMSGNVIRLCPLEPMGYFYAGVSTNRSAHPKEVKQYFKTFKKLGGDENMLLEK